MSEKKLTVGKDVYSELRKNNRTVWAVVLIALGAIAAMLYMSLYIYSDSTNKLYTVNNRGDLIPLSLVSEKKDKIKHIQGATEYFVRQFYDLDQYNIEEKKENVLWLVGEQPTKVIKDKANKGYYSNFLTLNGLVQKVQILNDTWNISNIEQNPNVAVSLLVKRINGSNEDFFKANITLRMAKSNINYPFNPYGFLITDFTEQLVKVSTPTEEETAVQDSLKLHNNPQTN